MANVCDWCKGQLPVVEDTWKSKIGMGGAKPNLGSAIGEIWCPKCEFKGKVVLLEVREGKKFL